MAKSTTLAVIPILAIAFALAVAIIFNITEPIFEPPYLILIANTIFLTGTSIVVAVISARSYLNGAPSNILMLGCAFLINGLAAVIAGWFFSFSVNFTVTIYNSCTLLSAILQFANVVFSRRGEVLAKVLALKKTSLRFKHATAYVLSVLAVFLITALTYYGFIPIFFKDNIGATPVGITVLATSILFFGLSSLFLIFRDMKSKSPALFWYSLGLALFAIGLFGVSQESSLGDPIGWIGKVAQYIGGIYFLIAVIMAGRLEQSKASYSERWAETFTTNPVQMTNLFENMTEGFALSKIVYDNRGEPIDYVTLQANQTWANLTGIKKETAIGRKITQVIPGIEKDPSNWVGRYSKVASTGVPAHFEAYAQQLGKWCSVTAYSPRKDYFVTIFYDITERKKAEEALKQSEERFAKAFNLSPFAVILTRLDDGTYVDVNDKFLKMFEFSRNEVIGHTATEIGIYANPNGRAAYIAAFKNGHVADFEVDLKAKTGRPIKALGFAEIIKIGGTDLTFGTLVDITERKHMEQRIEDYAKNLEKLVEERTKQLKDAERLAAIGATAGMVGHDIRNPLQAIISDVYLAKTDLATIPESDEKNSIQESLTEVEKNIDYINKIVQDLQDYARPLNPNPGEADLKLIIEKLLAKNDIPKNVKVNGKVEDDVKTLIADADYLNRILYNLVTNAVQAMPKGGKLTIHVYKEANELIIAVKDTGVGIPAAIQSKMFTPMFTTKSKGQGFGLPVVKRMTESLRGTVSFESEEGKGTTFIIRLPITPKS
jgi:PAS domain S-box-containing protein